MGKKVLPSWSTVLRDLIRSLGKEAKGMKKGKKFYRRAVEGMKRAGDTREEHIIKLELRNKLEAGDILGFLVDESSGRVVMQPLVDSGVEGSTTVERKNALRPKTDEKNPPQSWRESATRTDVKTGLYSKDEEETLKEAVRNFAINRGLSTEDYSWIIQTGRGQRDEQSLGVWSTVAQSLPRRTIKSVAAAGVRLFHPFANKGAWTADEDASLRAMVESIGTKWTKISHAIERTPESCRFRWREIKNAGTIRSGSWSKEEEDRLVEAVQKYGKPRSLKGNTTVKRKRDDRVILPDRRVILDDINWQAVVAHVRTRSRIQCITKWYLRLGPTMIERGEWAKGDDKKLLKALWNSVGMEGNVLEHEISWDSLVEGRTADQAKRRWQQMRKNVQNNKDYEFHDLVRTLAKNHLNI